MNTNYGRKGRHNNYRRKIIKPNPFLQYNTDKTLEEIRAFKLAQQEKEKKEKKSSVDDGCEDRVDWPADRVEGADDGGIDGDDYDEDYNGFLDECGNTVNTHNNHETSSLLHPNIPMHSIQKDILQDHSSMTDMKDAEKIHQYNIRNELKKDDTVLILSNNKMDFLALSFVEINENDKSVQFKDCYTGKDDFIYWLEELPPIFRTNQNTQKQIELQNEFEQKLRLANCMDGNNISDYKIHTKLYLESNDFGYGCYTIQGFDPKTTKCVLRAMDDNLVICYLNNTKHSFGRKSHALPIKK